MKFANCQTISHVWPKFTNWTWQVTPLKTCSWRLNHSWLCRFLVACTSISIKKRRLTICSGTCQDFKYLTVLSSSATQSSVKMKTASSVIGVYRHKIWILETNRKPWETLVKAKKSCKHRVPSTTNSKYLHKLCKIRFLSPRGLRLHPFSVKHI